MKLRHSKQLIVAAIAAVAIAVVAGGEAQASNMGFKFNQPIRAATGYPAGYHLISLPYGNPYVNMQDVCVALGLVGPATITQYDTRAGGAPTQHTCGGVGPPNLIPRLGIEVISPVAAGGILVGQHMPGSFHYDIKGRAPGEGYPAGQNVVTIPYHTTAATMEDVCTQLTAAGVPGVGTGLGVTIYDGIGPTAWACGGVGAPGFFLGAAFETQFISANPPVTTFTPAHF